MHPSDVVERTGTPPQRAASITTSRLDELKQAVVAWATALSASDAYRDASRLAEQLRQQQRTADGGRRTADGIIARYTYKLRKQ
jgi:hypothetical protein